MAFPPPVRTVGHAAISVLVVDDNDRYRQGIQRALGRRASIGAVASASDGVSALDAVRALRPDVVLMDQRMPGLDGTVVARAIRDDPALAGTRVVLTSADDDAALIARAYAAGATDWIDKAATRKEICEAVERAAREGER